MAIARQKLNAPTNTQPELPKIQPDDYQGVVTGDESYPISTLISYVQGAPWTVEYYSQLLGKHNNLRDFDPASNNPYQQYVLVKDLELRVSSALSESYNSETGVMKVSGAATLPMCVVPNVGDVFTATIDSGDVGIFRITNVERKSFNRQSIYHVEYDISNSVSQHPEWFDAIVQKVQRTYYFHKDRLVDGLEALVTPTQNEDIRNARDFLNKIVPIYFKTFFNKQYGTLVLPYQENSYYDPFLVRFLLKICGSFEAPEIRLIHNLSIQFDPYLSQPTIWDALLEHNKDILELANKKMAFVTPQIFFRNPLVESARYQRMTYMLYPYDPDTSVRLDIQLPPADALDQTLVPTTGHHGILDLAYNQYVTQNAIIPIIPQLFQDRYYVLSPAFYNDAATGKSLIETMVSEYFQNHSLDINKLLVIANRWTSWSRMEQFYFLPVLMLLLRNTLGGVSV
jgi:hypothetical protein